MNENRVYKWFLRSDPKRLQFLPTADSVDPEMALVILFTWIFFFKNSMNGTSHPNRQIFFFWNGEDLIPQWLRGLWNGNWLVYINQFSEDDLFNINNFFFVLFILLLRLFDHFIKLVLENLHVRYWLTRQTCHYMHSLLVTTEDRSTVGRVTNDVAYRDKPRKVIRTVADYDQDI